MPKEAHSRLENTLKRGNNQNFRISAIICTHNRKNYLAKALASLAQQTLDQSQYEVIVVDNASTDSTREIAHSFVDSMHIRCIAEPILGLSRARNTGFRHARGKYVAYLDDDAIASPDWLAHILRAFDTAQPTPAAVGGKVRLLWEEEQPKWIRGSLLNFLGAVDWSDKPLFLDDPVARYLAGLNIAYERSALEQLGGFSDTLGRVGPYLLSCEEIDMQRRLKERRHLVYYDPDIVVQHAVHPSRLTREWFLKRIFWNGVSLEIYNNRQSQKGAQLDHKKSEETACALLKKYHSLPPTQQEEEFQCWCRDMHAAGARVAQALLNDSPAAAGKPLYVILHIQKTGGSTIKEHLKKHLSPNELILSYNGYGVSQGPHTNAFPASRDFTPGSLRTYLHSLSEDQRADLCAIMGHLLISYDEIRALFPKRDIRFVTFLREPLKRTVSQYNHFLHYQIAANNGRGSKETLQKQYCELKKFLQNGKLISFEEFVGFPEVKNTMTQFLITHIGLGPPNLAQAKNILSEFFFVGIVEMFDEDARLLFRLMRLPHNSTKENVTNLKLGKQQFHFNNNPKISEKFYAINKMDLELYAYAKILNHRQKLCGAWRTIMPPRLLKRRTFPLRSARKFTRKFTRTLRKILPSSSTTSNSN